MFRKVKLQGHKTENIKCHVWFIFNDTNETNAPEPQRKPVQLKTIQFRSEEKKKTWKIPNLQRCVLEKSSPFSMQTVKRDPKQRLAESVCFDSSMLITAHDLLKKYQQF